MIRDWHALSLIKRGRLVHIATDPRCMFYVAARPGSPLDRWTRGVSCPLCNHIPSNE
jgi:hypothetical protein